MSSLPQNSRENPPEEQIPSQYSHVQRQTPDKATCNATLPLGPEVRGEASCHDLGSCLPESNTSCLLSLTQPSAPLPGTASLLALVIVLHPLNGPATRQASMEHKQEEEVRRVFMGFLHFVTSPASLYSMSTGWAHEHKGYHTCCPKHLFPTLLLHTQS